MIWKLQFSGPHADFLFPEVHRRCTHPANPTCPPTTGPIQIRAPSTSFSASQGPIRNYNEVLHRGCNNSMSTRASLSAAVLLVPPGTRPSPVVTGLPRALAACKTHNVQQLITRYMIFCASNITWGASLHVNVDAHHSARYFGNHHPPFRYLQVG